MTLTFNPWGLPNLLIGVVLVALSVLIYRAAPRRDQNRIVALILLIIGLAEGLAAALRFMVTDAGTAYGVWFVRILSPALAAPLLLALYGTLPSRFTGWLASARARKGLAGLAAAHVAVLLAFPGSVATGMIFVQPLNVWEDTGHGPLFGVTVLWAAAVLFAGLPIAWSAMRDARTDLERDKLRWLLVGFVGWGLLQAPLVALPESIPGLAPDPFWVAIGGFYGSAAASFVLAVSLGYGILQAQILDVEIKVKRGIHHSTLAAVFIAVFFVVSEGAQVVLGDAVGNELLGILAAGALVFALAPLHRLAQRISDAAMPGVEDTEAYRAKRKEDVYRATLEDVLRDGEITTKDRRILLGLQESLGLDAGLANDLEREVLDAMGATGGGA